MRVARTSVTTAVIALTIASGTSLVTAGAATAALPDTLATGGQLGAGQALGSSDGRYQVVMQTDGNLVVYGPSGPTWATGTFFGGSVLVMQTDGNLVMYAPGRGAVWATGTLPSYDDRLVMQTDGSLVVHAGGGLALWSSSGGRTVNRGNTLGTGQSLPAGGWITSSDGRDKAVMQTDGNLVVYGPTGPLWASGTFTGNGSVLVVQTDGNAVVYAPGRGPVWATGTVPSTGSRLVLQTDGSLVVLDGSGRTLWKNGQLTPVTPGDAPVDDYPSQWRDIPQDSVFDTWREYNRECTSFVAWRLHSRDHFEMPFHANANMWGPNAQALGYRVDATPTVGSVAWTAGGSALGHVAWVQAVNGTRITLEDYNSDAHGHYAVHYDVLASGYNYIHFTV